METLSIDGKEFVKASKIARELGYTSDYVGQLCRGGKIDAQLVGRSWYVDKESLLDHKENRYKKKLAGTDTSDDQVGEARKLVPNFYDRVNGSNINYSEDSSDLIPTPAYSAEKKSHKLPINLADAQNVSVRSNSEAYKFETPEQKKTIFKGDLVVSELPEIEFTEPKANNKDLFGVKMTSKKEDVAQFDTIEDTKPTKSTELKAETDDKKHKVKIKIEKQETKPRKHFSRIKKKVSAKQTVTEKKRRQKKTNELVVKSEDSVEPESVRVSYVFASAILAMLIALLLMSVESVVYVTEQIVLVEYKINASSLIAAVYGSK